MRQKGFLCRLVLIGLGMALMLAGCARDKQQTRPGRWDDQAFERGSDKPPTTKTLYATSKVLAAQNKLPECEHLLIRIIQDEPRLMAAYCDLAEVQMRQNQIDKAAATLAFGLKVSPADPVLLNNLGVCQLFKADYAKALDYFRQAAQSRPEEASYRANEALALGMLGREDEAQKTYRQILPPVDVTHNLKILQQARKNRQRASVEASGPPLGTGITIK
jgi:Flp pilus assembly protein TadD